MGFCWSLAQTRRLEVLVLWRSMRGNVFYHDHDTRYETTRLYKQKLLCDLYDVNGTAIKVRNLEVISLFCIISIND